MRAHSRNHSILSSRAGALSLPLLILIIALLPAMLGVPALMAVWHHTAKIQLELDECTGREALEFKSHILKLEAVNERIKAARALLLSGTLVPAAIPAVRLTLQTQSLYGAGLLGSWKSRQIRWQIQRCGEGLTPRTRVFPLPPLPFRPDGIDPLGPKPFRFVETPGARYRFLAQAERRSSHAEVKRRWSKWHAVWTRTDSF